MILRRTHAPDCNCWYGKDGVLYQYYAECKKHKAKVQDGKNKFADKPR